MEEGRGSVARFSRVSRAWVTIVVNMFGENFLKKVFPKPLSKTFNICPLQRNDARPYVIRLAAKRRNHPPYAQSPQSDRLTSYIEEYLL
jgi:hypothetical protein